MPHTPAARRSCCARCMAPGAQCRGPCCGWGRQSCSSHTASLWAQNPPPAERQHTTCVSSGCISTAQLVLWAVPACGGRKSSSPAGAVAQHAAQTVTITVRLCYKHLLSTPFDQQKAHTQADNCCASCHPCYAASGCNLQAAVTSSAPASCLAASMLV